MERCLIGFDGYRDELYRIVRKRSDAGVSCFENMEQFGEYLREEGRRSADVQILPVSAHYGGNGPLMAGAMASLGTAVTCIGLFDGCRELTGRLEERVSCISIGRCNRCIAMEFDNGKLMFGELNGADMTWRDFTERMDMERLYSEVAQCGLIAVVNWSAFFHMNDILVQMEKLIREKGGFRILFFDLADFSARSDEDVRRLLGILRDFGTRHQVMIGLNRKEAALLGKKAFGEELEAEAVGARLAKIISNGVAIIHDERGAACWHGGKRFWDRAEKIEKPRVMTGAGDHFNAGFCSAVLKGENLLQALRAGNRAAGYYIRYGEDMQK